MEKREGKKNHKNTKGLLSEKQKDLIRMNVIKAIFILTNYSSHSHSPDTRQKCKEKKGLN